MQTSQKIGGFPATDRDPRNGSDFVRVQGICPEWALDIRHYKGHSPLGQAWAASVPSFRARKPSRPMSASARWASRSSRESTRNSDSPSSISLPPFQSLTPFPVSYPPSSPHRAPYSTQFPTYWIVDMTNMDWSVRRLDVRSWGPSPLKVELVLKPCAFLNAEAHFFGAPDLEVRLDPPCNSGADCTWQRLT